MGFDMTPMIDVVLQLIIFFMYTTQFSQVVRSEVELPLETGEEEAVEQTDEIIIDVRADSTYLVAGVETSLDDVIAMVRAEVEASVDEPVRVLVRADKTAPARPLNELAERLALAGVKSWRLGTERPRGAPEAEGTP